MCTYGEKGRHNEAQRGSLSPVSLLGKKGSREPLRTVINDRKAPESLSGLLFLLKEAPESLPGLLFPLKEAPESLPDPKNRLSGP